MRGERGRGELENTTTSSSSSHLLERLVAGQPRAEDRGRLLVADARGQRDGVGGFASDVFAQTTVCREACER